MRMPLTGRATAGVDVLRWPVVGRFLRWRHARTVLQLALLVAAAIVVLHGLAGPDLAPANLATVLTWVHYRGLLVVALLAAGNFFCAGCPFVLVRDWGRRLHAPARLWPKRLRGKWIALVLFVGVLFAYELFDLWALPRATAYLVLAYFGAALAIDTVFKGATFCKHLCPIGQFNFVASTMSPLELQIREPATCQACRTSDCIAGRRSTPVPGRPQVVVQRGCELGLYLPAKVGNIDCTFCLDCVQACPHDNIALTVRAPGLELADARRRSGIGRLGDRPDIALLAVLFVFGALLNAFAMVGPVHHVEHWLAGVLGTSSEALVLGCLFVVGLGVAPLVLLGLAAALTRLLTQDAAVSTEPGGVALRLRSGAVRLRRVARALRLPLPDRCAHDRPRDAERGDRPHGMAGARRAAVAMGWDAAGCGLPDPTRMPAARDGGFAGRDAPHLAARLSRSAGRRHHSLGRRRRTAGGDCHLGAVPADGDERDGVDGMTRVAASLGARLLVRVIVVAFCAVAGVQAHSGPPFPIVSNQTSGAYTISVWTDPDSTDDGSAGGQFWVTVRPAGGAATLPADTRIDVTLTAARSARPAGDRAAPSRLRPIPSQRFAALVMDHEGRFRVRVTIDGPLGAAAVEADVDATYDTRPAPAMIAVYLLPFVLVGFLWIKLLWRRRRG